MIYKLYKFKYNNGLPSQEVAEGFKKIYAANDIETVGMWVNKDDSSEAYYVNGYKDEAHFNSFVEDMKNDDEYQLLTDKIKASQGEVEVVTLVDYNEATSK